MPGGSHGLALYVDLGRGSDERRAIPESVTHGLVGGVGLGAWLYAQSSQAGHDALAAEAPFVVALSPLVGTPLTTSAKFAVVAKSPLTERLCDALASDRFAIELKRTGVDAVVVTGRAQEWSLLVIEDDRVTLEPCPELTGLSAAVAEERLRARFGDGHRFFGIGPAGEALVPYSTVSGDGRHAGRGGLGAVLGAKRLKGLVVRGTGTVPLADTARVLDLAKDLSARSLGAGTTKYRELGTVANLLTLNRLSALPTRNFGAGSFEGAEELAGEALQASRVVRKHCAACTIGCEHVFATKSGRRVRVEYEGLFALGSLLGISDRDGALELAALCDDLGLDVISAGGTLAFAMECRERGLTTAHPELERLPEFGDAAGAAAALGSVVSGEGAGAWLALGSRRLAERLGGDAPSFAPHVKGLELPGYEPRAMQTLAVGLAVSSRGADHNKSGAYEADLAPGGDRFRATDDKGATAARSEVKAAVLDSLILCKFLRGVFHDVIAEGAELLTAVSGREYDRDELERVGRRIVTLRKLVNEREGWTLAEDTLPDRFLSEPLDVPGGPPVTLSRAGLTRMIQAYHRAQGWCPDGLPTDDLLRELGLERLPPSGAPVEIHTA